MREHWETLPDWLEEGVAEVVALDVIPTAREDAESHMRMVDGRYEAYMFARAAGLGTLRQLALRAHDEGLAEIHEAWLAELGALP